jgi:hypothetical protein
MVLPPLSSGGSILARSFSGESIAAIRPPTRAEIMDMARDLTTHDRNEAYGDPYPNMKDIAGMMSAYLCGKYGSVLSAELTAEDACWFQVFTKASRTFKSFKMDNYIDAVAYAAMAGECREIEENRDAQNNAERYSVAEKG